MPPPPFEGDLGGMCWLLSSDFSKGVKDPALRFAPAFFALSLPICSSSPLLTMPFEGCRGGEVVENINSVNFLSIPLGLVRDGVGRYVWVGRPGTL